MLASMIPHPKLEDSVPPESLSSSLAEELVLDESSLLTPPKDSSFPLLVPSLLAPLPLFRRILNPLIAP